MAYKLGSLFDGSGGFPLSGALCGIEPVWAAEVEPYPIAVTRSRFPNMKHLGDISKVSGGEIEPVDIITFGSPCQDLSVAGKRAGLKHEANGDEETTRSGLFMEAVRIIKEMRQATNGEYPRFALWENVPGAFSSNKGEDFRIVCEELIKIVEPQAFMPEVPQGGWNYADSYLGDGWSLSYRVLDAQYWGVPQRRRRIYLVADFRGECAREVLFERQGLRGRFTPCETERQGAPANAPESLGTGARECEGFDGYNGALTGDKSATLGVNCGMSTGRNGVIERDRGLDAVNDQNCLTPWDVQSRQIYTPDGPWFTLYAGEGGGRGYVITETNGDQETIAFHLTQDPITNDRVAPCLSSGNTDSGQACLGVALSFEPGAARRLGGYIWDGVAGTLRANAGDNRLSVAYTVDMGAGKSSSSIQKEKAPTLATTHGGAPAVVHQKDEQLLCVATQQGAACIRADDKDPTLAAAAGMSGNNQPYICRENKEGKGYIVRRLTPTECARLQGFADWWGVVEKKDNLTDEEYLFWMGVRNTHATINGRKVQEYTPKQMLTWYNKLWTDSSEYKMWGNGIALPTALYCMQGIAEALNTQEDIEEWML